MDKYLLCLLEEGNFLHPIYFCQGSEPILLQYSSVEKLSESLSQLYQTHEVTGILLGGAPSFATGIKERILTDATTQYGLSNIKIYILGEDSLEI